MRRSGPRSEKSFTLKNKRLKRVKLLISLTCFNADYICKNSEHTIQTLFSSFCFKTLKHVVKNFLLTQLFFPCKVLQLYDVRSELNDGQIRSTLKVEPVGFLLKLCVNFSSRQVIYSRRKKRRVCSLGEGREVFFKLFISVIKNGLFIFFVCVTLRKSYS